MILYQSDIDREHPFIHYNTKNDSFLRMAIVFKRMGIKNNTFHLTLYQKELEKVDPFDYTHINNELAARILYECKINPWYFFRECCRIPSAGDSATRFVANRFNLAFIWSFFNDIDIGVVVARQSGKTITTQALVCYMMYILADNIRIGLVTKDSNLCQDNVLRLKDIRDALPKYFIEKSVQDIDRKEGLSYDIKHNYYMTYTAATDERAAYRTARGSTMSLIHFDEIAFINYNWIIVPTVVNAMLKASEQARAAGLPSSVIYTTTAGNPDTKPGAYALSILDSAMPFSEQLYDLKDRNELIALTSSNSKNKMLYLEFSYRQLGKTDEWFKEAAARSKASQDDINRDLLNIWQSSSDGTVIPGRILAKLREGRMDPAYVDLSSGFVVRWYEAREIIETEDFKNRPLIMGMDTSENVGRDFTTFTILDPKDMHVVATCRCNDSNTMGIARRVLDLLLKYPRLVWIPERQSTAAAIIDFVMEELQKRNINPFLRIFNDVVQNYDDPKYKNTNIYNFHDIYGSTRATFGYRTSGSGTTSRNMLYKVTMMKALEMNANKIYDKDIIIELSNLTIRNERVDHERIGHDDACFIGTTLVRTNTGNKMIKDIQVGDLVLTREGYKPVLCKSIRKAKVIKKFGLVGTPEHPFITPSGIKEFQKLHLWSKVYIWNEKQSSIMAKSIIGILIQKGLSNIFKNLKTSILQLFENKYKEDYVYNLTIADCHEYFVNDILVHNCISLLLACYFVFFGKNLHMYGIPRGTVLQSVELNDGTTITQQDRQEQIDIKRRIASLEELVARNPSHILKQGYLRELNILKQQLDESVIVVAPVAVSQMEYDEREVKGIDPKRSYDSIRSFHQRWTSH